MLVNMSEILRPTLEKHFAVPAFNTSSNMILTASIEVAEELNAPVIIEIHPDELRFVKDSFVAAVRAEANRTKVPVCIHLDHGASFADTMHAIGCGFTSVMIDGSALPYEENAALAKKVAEAAHAAGVSVEAELGTIGTMEGNEIHYTQPDEARAFVEATGVDTLAVAIGTRHGLYPKGLTPHLELELLRRLREAVDIPLVLHGGSDNPDSEIEQACLIGISKINISSDIKKAFYQKCREVLADESLREPNAIYPPCIEEMKKVMRHKFRLFHADGKAELY
jgi:fructose-bisphosphate aldolase class II